ncbi:MAG: RpiB/LacA/LacB family sugar-phosphate isomerase [Nannocystaceae bacterium]
MHAYGRVHIGNDHGGLGLRQPIVEILARALRWEVASLAGPASLDLTVDYPDIAAKVCDAVARDPGSLGILLCGTGQGMAMSANRREDIRAGVVSDVFSARMLREHNNANVLCLGARVLGSGVVEEVVRTFLSVEFCGDTRHRRRIDKLSSRAPDTQTKLGGK